MTTKSRLDNFLKLGFSLILFLSAGYIQAQQDAQFTQYMYNGMFYNPAFAGKESGYRFSALHRSQWMNYTTSSGQGGAPVTQLITAEGRLDAKNIGYGLSIVNDQIGATGNLEINLKGSYHKKINRATLSLGGYFGIYSSSLDYGEIVV
ncbi:MAG TPA: PorP/SprF family type IX secretion system membrane protein, partial [Algoriphagus sp.]|nr:PorP/SprF family type IX secretion system membrane protein [Algoriphagus sp.]